LFALHWVNRAGRTRGIAGEFAGMQENRQQGIGSELISRALCAARQMDVLRITLLTNRDNLRAQAFYENQRLWIVA